MDLELVLKLVLSATEITVIGSKFRYTDFWLCLFAAYTSQNRRKARLLLQVSDFNRPIQKSRTTHIHIVGGNGSNASIFSQEDI